MNKIKIIYDVVKKMKDKEVFKGVIKAEGMKDQIKIFEFNNTFEKNNLTGSMKGKTNIEVDCEGKKMKMENNIDFEGDGCMRHGPHSFMKHFHTHHHEHHHHGHNMGGFKEGLSRITAALGILSSIRIDEREDQSIMLSLESADIPEDIKKGIHEKMKHGCEHHANMQEDHKHHEFMKEFHSMDNTEFTLSVLINKESEIEEVKVKINGEQKDEKKECHDMKLTAELHFEW